MIDHPPSRTTIVSIDPGRAKCGVAVVSHPPFQPLYRAVVATEELVVSVGAILRRYPEISMILLGNGTHSRTLKKALGTMFPKLSIEGIDEHGSSQRAREQYLSEHPPLGWRKLIPKGLRAPEGVYDDLVAEILAKEFFQRR